MGKKKDEEGDSCGLVLSGFFILSALMCVISAVVITELSGLYKYPGSKLGPHMELGFLRDRPFSMVFIRKDSANGNQAQTWFSLMNVLDVIDKEYQLASASIANAVASVAGNAMCGGFQESLTNLSTRNPDDVETSETAAIMAQAAACSIILQCEYVDSCRAHVMGRSTAYKTWVYGGTGTGLFFTFLGVNMGLFTALCIQCEPSPSKKFKKRQEARMNSLIMGCVTFASFLILIVTVLICAHLGLKFNNVIFPKYGFSTWFFIYIGGLVIVSICALTLVFRYTCMDDGQGDGDWGDDWGEGDGEEGDWDDWGY